MTKDIQKKVNAAFDFNKNVNRLFVTSDGTCFPSKSDAKAHLRNLDNKKIHEVTRNGKTEEVSLVSNEANKKKAKGNGKADTDPNEVTDEQLRERLTKDFTIKEKLEIASELGFAENEVKDLKDDELSLKLIELCSETQKELLIQKTEEKLDK